MKAASEVLEKLKEKESKKVKATNQVGSETVQGFPSASQEVLDAQRKRFEELQVCPLFFIFLNLFIYFLFPTPNISFCVTLYLLCLFV